MILNLLTQHLNRHQRNFRLAKASSKYTMDYLERQYRNGAELALIASLLIIILLFQFFPRFGGTRGDDRVTAMPLMEVVEIQTAMLIKPLPPPPPIPIAKTIESIAVIVKNDATDSLKDLKKNIKLDLELELNDQLYADSQLGEVKVAGFNNSKLQYNKVSLDILSGFNKLHLQENGNLNLEVKVEEKSKRYVEESVDLENNELIEPSVAEPVESAVSSIEEGLINLNANQFLLKESESTIGTAEYRLWNKINSALDRLNKNRYGSLPPNVHRTKSGMSVSFRYGNGLQHDIFWHRGGKVMIRVTGKQPANLVVELERALDALIGLTIS